MKKNIIALLTLILCFSSMISAQIPTAELVRIVRAEDERRFDETLKNLLGSRSAQVRARAALAAGRIGDEMAVPALAALLSDREPGVAVTVAFALGEVESLAAADAVLNFLRDAKTPDPVRARLVEAAGKIAAANAKDAKAKELGKAILDVLENESKLGAGQRRDVALMALTAALRVRPDGADVVTARFLNSSDARVRADAANTLSRLRAKNANEQLRAMLRLDSDAVARANAARALGAAEDKDSFAVLLDKALKDEDERVRVSALRSLGSLKDARAADKLLERGDGIYMGLYGVSPGMKSPSVKNELLEIAAALGRLLPNTNDARALKFLNNVRTFDDYSSSETEIAYARVAPRAYVASIIDAPEKVLGDDWRSSSAVFQGLGEIANLPPSDENNLTKSSVRLLLVRLIGSWVNSDPKNKAADNARYAMPDLLRAFAAFKSENTSNILRPMLEIEQDLFIRAAIIEILAEQPVSKENVEILGKAFDRAFLGDKDYNDAALAALDAVFKLDKKEAVPTLFTAATSRDYLVRKKAFDLLSDESYNDSKLAQVTREKYLSQKKNRLAPFSFGSKLGVILNTNADYTRAVSRKNASTKAVLTTERGVFTINLFPEEAPLTVDNFIKLARSGYFNGLLVHRVVPNFVMQDGDPRGDGNGGPGWQIRCELNMLSYERGAVGMALSGKDTGGSQWFVTHSPQPHLDGGYTIFGRVNETDMKIVDNIARGDKILSVKIMEGKTPPKRK